MLGALLLVLAAAPGVAHAQESSRALRVGAESDWPAWRGPWQTGISHAKELPTQWGAEDNIVWKTPLDGWGDSTPAIVGEALFVTSQNDADELKLWKLNANSGEVLLEIVVDQSEVSRTAPFRKAQKFHQLHNMASPSPVVTDQHVVVHFGNGLLAVFTHDGKEVWRRNLQEEFGQYTIWWGHANSPVVYEGLVISVCMQDSLSDLQDKPVESYLVAHDLKTGQEKWKTTRMTEAPGEEADAYTTPLLIEQNGQTQLVVMGANQLDAYDPLTGKRLWYLPGLDGGRTVTGPVIGEGKIFTTRGMRGALLAVKLDQFQGEVGQDAIVWSVSRTTPDTPTPVYWDGLLFTVTDDGVGTCYAADTGEVHWQKRLGGGFKASLVAADGNVYFLNVDGKCTVVKATAEYQQVAENQLPDRTLASPAIAGGRLFIRGDDAVYCIGK